MLPIYLKKYIIEHETNSYVIILLLYYNYYNID